MALFEPNNPEIDRILSGSDGLVLPFVRRFAEEVAEAARTRAPNDFGHGGALRDDIHVEDDLISPEYISLRVATDPIDPVSGFGYALVAHEGHGVIHAKNKLGMSFFWARINQQISGARTVGGTGGTPFLTDALIEVNATAVDGFDLEPGDQNGPIG